MEVQARESIGPEWMVNARCHITPVNWMQHGRSIDKDDTWIFSNDGIEFGWDHMIPTAELAQQSGWLGPDECLLFRASCLPRPSSRTFKKLWDDKR